MGVPSAAEAGRAEVAKKPYKNQTAGWLGVVKLNHLGAQEGVSVAPYGTVYLSDDEAVLTARAPAQAKDNPFVEQQFEFVNSETGAHEMHPMIPLVLVEDSPEIADEHARYVPGTANAPQTESKEAADRATADAALAQGTDRPIPTTSVAPTLVPSSTAAVPPSHTRPGAPPEHEAPSPEDDRQSWVDNPERTEAPQPGALGGTDQAAGAPLQGEPPAPEGGAIAGTATVESSTPGSQAFKGSGDGSTSESAIAGEETAGVTPTGEETGAAQTPANEAPEGEYAANEEVGSPDAPTQVAPDEETGD
jgi:hypothetical protein